MIENQLVTQLQANEPAAFRNLVANYQDLVVNTCYGFVQHREDAEDVAQEVFIEVHRSIHKFRGDAKLSTWLYRIAMTKSIDFLRSKKRKKWMSSLQVLLGGEKHDRQVEDRQSANPHTALENVERQEILAKAVSKLPENQQIAFTLSKFEGLSYKQIAEVMNTSQSSVESLLFRAKRNLKKLLFEYYKNQNN